MTGETPRILLLGCAMGVLGFGGWFAGEALNDTPEAATQEARVEVATLRAKYLDASGCPGSVLRVLIDEGNPLVLSEADTTQAVLEEQCGESESLEEVATKAADDYRRLQAASRELSTISASTTYTPVEQVGFFLAGAVGIPLIIGGFALSALD